MDEQKPAKWDATAIWHLLRVPKKSDGPWDDFEEPYGFPSPHHASLIAAAPNLLEALEYAVEALDSENPDIQLRAAINARAAIAKTKEEIKYEWT